jgi:hypothetical protein
MMQEHKLVGRTLVVIDGAFFDGNASKASITPHHRLAERVADLEKDLEKEIEAYNDDLEGERRCGGPEQRRLAQLARQRGHCEESRGADGKARQGTGGVASA